LLDPRYLDQFVEEFKTLMRESILWVQVMEYSLLVNIL
jgi:hypothetical protein